MIALAVAAAAAISSPSLLDEAAHAIHVHRFQEARLILSQAQSNGLTGSRLDHLLADLAFEQKDYPQAELRYASLQTEEPNDSDVVERAAIAAFKAGDTAASRRFAQIAVVLPGATWRAWNVKGVLCDYSADWDCADKAFEAAGKLAPNQPEIINNEGWSRALRGDWSAARELFRRAAALDPNSVRIVNNLNLADAAVAEDLPRRRAGESDAEFAARLNDVGVVAQQRGDNGRAVAAFSQAIEQRDFWYTRAANNLAAAGGK
jgi:tetratricopeptide (TPR) repeat protein